MTDQLARLLGQVPAPTPGAATVGVRPAQVTRSDATGVWVTPVGTSTASPVGPCRNAGHLVETRYSVTIGTGSVQFYRYVRRQLPVGTAVLVANSDTGAWVLAHDLPDPTPS